MVLLTFSRQNLGSKHVKCKCLYLYVCIMSIWLGNREAKIVFELQ